MPVVTVDPDTMQYALGSLFPQRRTLHMAGRKWVFYWDGYGAVFRSSVDGVTWSDKTLFKTGVTNMFDVFFDGTYVHYANNQGGWGEKIKYRRGTPTSEGEINWLDEQDVIGDVGFMDYPVSIAVDSNGYPCITYRKSDASLYARPMVIKSSRNDGTWETESGYPKELKPSDDYGWITQCVALTGGKMFFFYASEMYFIRGRLLSDSTLWQEEVCSVRQPELPQTYKAITEGDDIHLAYLEMYNYNVKYRRRVYGTGWVDEVTVCSTANNRARPQPYLMSPNHLVVFWAGYPLQNEVYQRECIDGGWSALPVRIFYDPSTIDRHSLRSPDVNGMYYESAWMVSEDGKWKIRYGTEPYGVLPFGKGIILSSAFQPKFIGERIIW